MKLDRTYQRRNKLVHLDELSDLTAIRRPEGATSDSKKTGLSIAKSGLELLNSEITLPQVRALEDSGWILVTRDKLHHAPADAVQAKVFMHPGGRLALGTGNLTVKFSGKTTQKEAEATLHQFGCRTIEELTFAPNLYRAAVIDTRAGDVLDVANALTKSGQVEFAEPELIEVTGHR